MPCEDSDTSNSSNFLGFKRKSPKQYQRDQERSKIWKQNKQVSQKDSVSQTDIFDDSQENVKSHLGHVECDTLFTVHEPQVQTTSTPVSHASAEMETLSGERDANLDSVVVSDPSPPQIEQSSYPSHTTDDEPSGQSNEQKVSQGIALWKYATKSEEKYCPRCKICERRTKCNDKFGHCNVCLSEKRFFDFHASCLEKSGLPKHKHEADVVYGIYPDYDPYDFVVPVK